MDQKMKKPAYSLISVLVAMVILMVALMPLLSIQSRLLNHFDGEQLIDTIEVDFSELRKRASPPKAGFIETSQITREVESLSDNLYLIRYHTPHFTVEALLIL